MEKKTKVQRELEAITSSVGYRAGTLQLLIEIRDELRKLTKTK